MQCITLPIRFADEDVFRYEFDVEKNIQIHVNDKKIPNVKCGLKVDRGIVSLKNH